MNTDDDVEESNDESTTEQGAESDPFTNVLDLIDDIYDLCQNSKREIKVWGETEDSSDSAAD
jgi:hypothetical protein